jgi:replicative DNA helicase
MATDSATTSTNEQVLIKSCLNYSFFEANKSKLVSSMFSENSEKLWDTIKDAHARYKHDLSITELRFVYEANNPAATRAQKAAFYFLLDELEKAESINEDIARDAIIALWRKETARQIGEIAVDIANGKERNFAEITTIISGIEASPIPNEKYTVVDTDLDKLLEQADDKHRWKFNIPELGATVGGIAGGELGIIFARPECGKTAAWVSLCASPAGFAEQGANVHAIINEEPAYRTMLRAVSAYTGATKDVIISSREAIKGRFQGIAPRLKFIDSVDFTVDMLDAYVAKEKPDIVIVDQLDKLHIDGTFARTDERLKAIYVYAREIAKRHGVAVFGISQASAEAEGKRVLSMDMLENSRTGKAAEADLIIGIGKSPMGDDGQEDYTRTLNILKNKITGFHGLIHCILRPQISRYEG